MYVAVEHKIWDAVSPLLMYAFNTARLEVTGYTPLFLLYACHHSSFDAFDASRLARLRTLSSHAHAPGTTRGVYQSVSLQVILRGYGY